MVDSFTMRYQTYLDRAQPSWWEGYRPYRTRCDWAIAWARRHSRNKDLEKSEALMLAKQVWQDYQQAPWYRRWLLWWITPINRLAEVTIAAELSSLSTTNLSLRQYEILITELKKNQRQLSWFSPLRSLISTLLDEITMRYTRVNTEDTDSQQPPNCCEDKVLDLLQKTLAKMQGKLLNPNLLQVIDFAMQRTKTKKQEENLAECEAYRREQIVAALWQEGNFPGWLARLNLNTHLTMAYYDSLRMLLPECIQALQEQKVNDENWAKLVRLLHEGALLKPNGLFTPIHTRVIKLYQALVSQLAQLDQTDKDIELNSFSTSKLEAGLVELSRLNQKLKVEINSTPDAEKVLLENDFIGQYHQLKREWQSLSTTYLSNDPGLLSTERDKVATLSQAIETRFNTLKQQIECLAFKGSTFDQNQSDILQLKDNALNARNQLSDSLASYAQEWQMAVCKAIMPLSQPSSSMPQRIEQQSLNQEPEKPLNLSTEAAKACQQLGLDIQKPVTWSMIRDAYKNLALRYHPDKKQYSEQECNNMFQQIQAAYALLDEFKLSPQSVYQTTQTTKNSVPFEDIADTLERIRKLSDENRKWLEEALRNYEALHAVVMEEVEKQKMQEKHLQEILQAQQQRIDAVKQEWQALQQERQQQLQTQKGSFQQELQQEKAQRLQLEQQVHQGSTQRLQLEQQVQQESTQRLQLEQQVQTQQQQMQTQQQQMQQQINFLMQLMTVNQAVPINAAVNSTTAIPAQAMANPVPMNETTNEAL